VASLAAAAGVIWAIYRSFRNEKLERKRSKASELKTLADELESIARKLLHDLERLSALARENRQNTSDGSALQERINGNALQLREKSVQLVNRPELSKPEGSELREETEELYQVFATTLDQRTGSLEELHMKIEAFSREATNAEEKLAGWA
jgi:hypothetical protein